MDYTYTLQPGTKAVAQQVNKNFDDAKQAIDTLEVDVANIETQLTGGFVLPDGAVDFTRLQSYETYVVSNATNATTIVVTAVAHSFLTGDKVYISGVGGNTAANGVFTITKIGDDTFSLDGSVGNGAFSSNGSVVIYPSADKNLVNKAYVDNKHLPDTIVALGTVSTGTTTLTADKFHTVTFSGASTIALPTGLTSGVHYNCSLLVTMSSIVTITQPTVTWAYGATPALTSTSVKYRITYETIDGGTTWYGYWTQLGA